MPGAWGTTGTAPAAPAAGAAGTGMLGTVTLTGVAFAHTDVANWLESLAREKGYAGPLLQSSTEALLGTRKVVNWSVTVTLTPEALSGRYAEDPGADVDKLKQWVALTLVAVLGVGVAGWVVLISPRRSEAADLRRQAVDVTRSDADLRTQLQVLKAQAAALPQEQASLAQVALQGARHPGPAGPAARPAGRRRAARV